MPHVHFVKSGVLIAAASAFLTSSALAQPYGNGPTESVIVVAPRLHVDTAPLGAPMERASLSMPVRYDDLNLLTRGGARELRWRIWRTANEVCDRLADAYPVYQLSTDRPCVRTAYENAMVRAYGAIDNERVNYWSPE